MSGGCFIGGMSINYGILSIQLYIYGAYLIKISPTKISLNINGEQTGKIQVNYFVI
jgi:hypothetical protein